MGSLRHANVLILTDEAEFARLLSACWQAERHAPRITVLTSEVWQDTDASAHDLVVLGPVKPQKLSAVLGSVQSAAAVILCGSPEAGELARLRAKHPRLLHVPLREDWTQTVLLVAGESLRRSEALKAARRAEDRAARNQHDAMLGRYMLEMKHSVNNALTSALGNAELLLLEPGQLSSQSLAQIKTIHSMALRINEIMLRFSSLSSEMHDAETSSQAETLEAAGRLVRHR
jgi:signal transduction histidine kinase